MFKLPIPLDKQAHFLAGLSICLAFALFVSPLLGLIIASAIGATKELWDGMIWNGTANGTSDFWDFVATALGGVAGFVLIAIQRAFIALEAGQGLQ